MRSWRVLLGSSLLMNHDNYHDALLPGDFIAQPVPSIQPFISPQLPISSRNRTQSGVGMLNPDSTLHLSTPDTTPAQEVDKGHRSRAILLRCRLESTTDITPLLPLSLDHPEKTILHSNFSTWCPALEVLFFSSCFSFLLPSHQLTQWLASSYPSSRCFVFARLWLRPSNSVPSTAHLTAKRAAGLRRLLPPLSRPLALTLFSPALTPPPQPHLQLPPPLSNRS
ncbi:hypothetical protein DFH08DRAFT_873724 [Mycena albidolilacea]|uniref:Uncharacterized protein n=1 Tax=Mycena albidolilacea TaxID=1033008 RepID=A0AAD6ZWB2_9AGAR|nr:hypothetical protein DFH08DRAFT_873724 [Mycena albidolilacea]